jgi:DNA-binding LytR/AlgR family response regulator
VLPAAPLRPPQREARAVVDPAVADRRWTAVVAEDETLLRDALLAQLAEAWPGLEVVAACDDGATALEALAEHQPDVAFLDIRMPGLTGLEVANAAAEASPRTQVVFVTAYDQYAIDAFEQGAIDYLLKPVASDRLAATVQRLQARGQADAMAIAAALANTGASLARRDGAREPLTWLTASAGRETRLVLVDDVAYFRASDKYTSVVTGDGEALLRTPIRELLERLDPSVFKQVHRSTIVNLRAVASVVRDESGRGILRLRNRPETLTVSQPFMTLFRNM